MKIIAEFGVNFIDDLNFIKMLDECQKLGIKMVKLQLFQPEDVPKELRDMYIDSGRASAFMFAGKKRGIDVFFTPMYPEAVDICERMEVKYYKIRFFDRNNLIIYRKIKKTDKPIFVSCNDPKDTIFYNISRYQERINFLYCIPQYPAPMKLYLQHWNNNIFSGFSDHTKNTELLKIAKDMNVDWFEVHVKLDDNCYEKAWSKSFKELKEVLEWK